MSRDVFGDECVDDFFPELDGPVVDCGLGTGLIIEAETGVWYTNQTHGVACQHPCVQGFYVPLPEHVTRQFPPELADHGCWGGVPGGLADWIDAYASLLFHVDRDRAAAGGDEWGEAWVPIVTCQGNRGVLTYANCD